MDNNAPLPNRLNELPAATRMFWASVRSEELENLKRIATLRADEMSTLMYIIEAFNTEDLQVIEQNLENMRTIKRFGKFGLWMFGFIVAGAAAAALIKGFFSVGTGK
jgi:hypothetical protein